MSTNIKRITHDQREGAAIVSADEEDAMPHIKTSEHSGSERTSNEEQQVTIRRLQQELESKNEIIYLQSTMIQELKQETRSRAIGRLTNTNTREEQSDQDYFANHAAIQHGTPSITSSNVEYFHHVTDRWFDVIIERPRNAEPPGTANTGVLRLYNASNLTWSHYLNEILQTKLPRLGAVEKLYYHGSNDFNVKSILENGIDVTKSVRATDFSCGRGFYVTKNLGKAVEWSKRVVGWKRGRPAVIAFRINKSLRKEEPHLALKVDTTTNRKWWQCVVTYFRHSATSTDVGNVLTGVKFIKGPVANNKYVLSDELPRPFKFTQLCIRDEEYARRFGSIKNIAFVIFAVDT